MEQLVEKIAELECQVETLECQSRRNNLKILGIKEGRQETYERCAEVVVDFLNYFATFKQWSVDDIERAHRLGKSNDTHRPRPLIVKLYRWSDKIQLLRNRQVRSIMRKEGYRIASDLTKKQTAQLRAVQQEGKRGYFRNGRLQVQDNRRRDQRGGARDNRRSKDGVRQPGNWSDDDRHEDDWSHYGEWREDQMYRDWRQDNRLDSDWQCYGDWRENN